MNDHKKWEDLKMIERNNRIRSNMNSPYFPQRRTRKFLGLKIAGGLLVYLISLVIYLAILAAFVFFLVWGSIKIVKSQTSDDTPPTTPVTEHPVTLTHGGNV